MTLAIVKPDHLGDLVLSSAAIRAMLNAQPDAHLYIASRNIALARHLFPDAEIRSIDFPHLAKAGSAGSPLPDLAGYDLVTVLRYDQVLTRDWMDMRTRAALMAVDTNDNHQSLMDYTVAYFIAGDYDIDEAFFGSRLQRVVEKAERPIRRVGLSIGSGFHANAWPVTYWATLARLLLDRADEVVVLGGPGEREKAAFILDRLGGSARARMEIGGADIGAFIAVADDMDLIVASDGGTAHLCSLVTPMLSVFGPSPFRRYAPYGRLNKLLTRELPCTPCCQYASMLVNGCLTTECMTGLRPKDVLMAMDAKQDPAGKSSSYILTGDIQIHIGISHEDRDHRIAEFKEEARLAIHGTASIRG
jgi:heptosyltransferase-2